MTKSWLEAAEGVLDNKIQSLRSIPAPEPGGNGDAPSILQAGMDPRDPNIFEEDPVPLDRFVVDKHYLASPRLSEEQFRLVALGSALYFDATYSLLAWPYLQDGWWRTWYTELAAEWGKGSGKDYCCRITCAYTAHLLLCLRDPHLYYGIDTASSIDILNVAVSSRQANDVFFEPLKRMVGSSPWFSDKYDFKVGKIIYAKNITSHSGHGDQESLEGFNLILGIADEIAAFKTREETRTRVSPRAGQHSADAISDMLRSSGQSRFPGIAKVIYISYPRFRGDFIEQKLDQSLAERTVYGTKKATWDVNPTKTRQQFYEEYQKDPEGAAAKYECKPPAAINKFFRNDRAIDNCFDQRVPKREPVDDLGFLLSDWIPSTKKPMAGHIDLGITRDRMAICLCHMQDWHERRTADGHLLRQPIVFVDLITSFGASELGVSELDISIAEDLVMEVQQRGGNIRLITADQYQSTEMRQTLRKRGMETRHRSVDRDTSAYDTAKSAIYQGRVVAYYRKRLVQELKGVKLVNGVKVDHEPGGSKDEADAFVGAVTGVVELAWEQAENEITGEDTGWADGGDSYFDAEKGKTPWDRRARFGVGGMRVSSSAFPSGRR